MDDTMGDKTDTMEKEQGQSWEIAGWGKVMRPDNELG